MPEFGRLRREDLPVDVEAGEGRSGRGRTDDVIGQDRHRPVVRVDDLRAGTGPGRRPRRRSWGRRRRILLRRAARAEEKDRGGGELPEYVLHHAATRNGRLLTVNAGRCGPFRPASHGLDVDLLRLAPRRFRRHVRRCPPGSAPPGPAVTLATATPPPADHPLARKPRPVRPRPAPAARPGCRTWWDRHGA